MDIPINILERYINIKKLAEHGVGGEKVNAQRMLEKLEEKHPNIAYKAKLWQQLNDGKVNEPEVEIEDDRPHWSDVFNNYQKRNANWRENISNWSNRATDAFSWVANVASQAYGVHEARNLAQEQHYSTISSRRNATGSVSYNIKLNPETVQACAHMNDDQKQVFVSTLSQRLAQEIFYTI